MCVSERERERENERERETERDKERERLMKVIFFWEIRTDNPSLAGKILNDTPRLILPIIKAWLA